jgi:Eukaryotic cytochrome b561
MLEWLVAPMDQARAHDLALAVAWHGRLMVLAWSLLFPAGIFMARFFKITPRQKWPDETDNKIWWHAHLTLHALGAAVVVVAVGLIWQTASSSAWNAHSMLGWLVVSALVGQFVSGLLRGTKGGPTALAADGSQRGDHYDMTRRRRAFEGVHKSVGYVGLLLSVGASASGFWLVNAPRWMPLVCALWWAILVVAWSVLQWRGFAVDTYQAIWGPNAEHPGNAKPLTWGMHRLPPTTNMQDNGKP